MIIARIKYLTAAVLAVMCLTGCMKWEYGLDDDSDSVHLDGNGLFIINEGNFQYGNATLSYYDPATGDVQNEVFYRANSMKLGDVAQSMTIHDNTAWVVVNNSHVVFAIDTETAKEKGRITNLTSPRYMHFVSDEKAYITQIWDNRIFVVDPRSYTVTGYITVPDMKPGSGSTEQMVQLGDYVYCNCWSYQNRIIKIDTRTDKVVAGLEVGIQPTSLVADADGMLWTVTDGGLEGTPYGHEPPTLVCIDPATFSVCRRFVLDDSERASEICISGGGHTLYWLNGGVWRMDIHSTRLPSEPFIAPRGTIYYGLTVDPHRGDVYVADAIDYQQSGIIYRYDSDGNPAGSFYVGTTPGAFCWK